MDERQTWLSKLLGATDKALDLTHRSDPSLYLALLGVRRSLERQAARRDADAGISRARSGSFVTRGPRQLA